LARMVLEADRLGCVREVLVIASALSIQDPRERPLDSQQQAAQLHARFRDETSDFLAYINLWDHLLEQRAELSGNQFRRMCKAEFLHYLRVREWQDLFGQLRRVAQGLGLALNDAPADPIAVHRSLLAGLLSHIGLKDVERQEYLGARGARFAVFPGSALFRKTPYAVMAAELVETSRLWGRTVARIEPEWVEPLAGHLVKRTYSEPHWEKKRGGVVAYERVTLYGVPIVARRKVDYGRIDPELSRELFLRHALVEGDWATPHAFWHENRRLLEQAEELEHRARRRDLLVDDETLFAFYDARVPRDVVSARHFDSWWKKARRTSPDLLTFPAELLLRENAADVRQRDYPDVWRQGALELALSYAFEPGTHADGVTVHVPLSVLNQLRPDGFDWQVPGLRHELVTALIRALPKALRVNFVPAPDWASRVLERLIAASSPLVAAVGDELRRMTGVIVPPDAWDLDRVPPHLRMTFRVEDEQGRPLAAGKDLQELKRRLQPKLRAAIAEVTDDVQQRGLRSWSIGTLPRVVERRRAGLAVKGYPALVDEGETVAVRVFETEAEQRRALWAGERRLLALTVPSPVKPVVAGLSNTAKLALGLNPHGGVPALLEDCLTAALDALIAECGGPAWDAEGFARLVAHVRAELPDTFAGVLANVERILATAAEVGGRLQAPQSAVLLPAYADLEAQLSALIRPGFVTAAGARRLPDVQRYLRAMERRLDRLPQDSGGDRARMVRLEQVQQAYAELLAGLPPERRDDEAVRAIRWSLEELRVSLFAQGLRTAIPVSEKRLLRAIDDLRP
ncbi:MAG: ATP-dependent RNA helicase HrpA, partial [Actinomycetota bacterium]|nr:ATP-dependent RNA helicase HrpA [Actinomycetota bacterium]